MKKIKKILKHLLILTIVLIGLYLSLYVYAKLTDKLNINLANNYYFYDNQNNQFNGNDDNWVPLDQISPHLINATIATEDKHFYKHIGFDYLRIIKAMINNIKNHSMNEGASTITQQYAKNLFLDFGKTWKRKIDEAWLTIKLESQYTKKEILEGYLNSINYGGVFGIEKASMYYFNKHAKELNLAEASILAGIPKSPTNYSPISNYENAKERQQTILESMVQSKYINEQEKNEAYNQTLSFIGENETNKISSLMYYQDAVINELKSIKSIPPSFLDTHGLKIYTNLNIEYQKNLDNSINNNLKENKDIQVASIIMNPSNGKILALTGGKDYKNSQYNRAINSKRQVGSTIKPLLYYAALENGFTASSTFTSEKTTFTFQSNQTYSPKNYGDIYPNKNISMAAAISYSDNIFAVKTHLFLGEETLVNLAHRIGIEEKLEAIPSLALGTEEISLIEMMEAYGTLASLGYKNKPYLIEKIEDSNGNTLYEHKDNPSLVLNSSQAFILNEMLTSTYSSDFIDYNYPTLISLAGKLNHKYAIKTGTTDTDRLIFGYNPDIIMGVWTGYDDNRETPAADSGIAKNIWKDTVEECLKNTENNWYKIPDNVVGVLVNPITGEIADDNTNHKRMFYYIKGTEPTLTDENLDILIPTIKEEE
ncbi:MAG: PBP1A family penicillin-binding protein [Bacilli bacterium]|nr:PBP1A family penicillin-binding protein [Bacilli bacterium]